MLEAEIVASDFENRLCQPSGFNGFMKHHSSPRFICGFSINNRNLQCEKSNSLYHPLPLFDDYPLWQLNGGWWFFVKCPGIILGYVNPFKMGSIHPGPLAEPLKLEAGWPWTLNAGYPYPNVSESYGKLRNASTIQEMPLIFQRRLLPKRSKFDPLRKI